METMDYPSVSVIVGAYNHERFVRECLDSIVATSYPNLDLIIFNDCSSDNTSEVIRDWIVENAACNVQFIDHPENVGLTRSLNEAIDLTHGDYCCLIAADDAMLPNGIADRVQYLQAHPDMLAVFADAHMIDGYGRQIGESTIEWSGDKQRANLKSELKIEALIPFSIVFHRCVAGPVFMCRRQVFELTGKYDESLFAEDLDMYLRLAAIGRLGFLDSHVAKYRLHDHNVSNTASRKNLDSIASAARKHLHNYGLLCRLRLRSYIYYSEYMLTDSPLERMDALLKHKVTLFISWRVYSLRKRAILRTTGLTGRNHAPPLTP